MKNKLRGTTQIPANRQTLVCDLFAIILQTVSWITEDKSGSLTLQKAFQFTLRKDLLPLGLSRLTPDPRSLSTYQKHTCFHRRFNFLDFGIMPQIFIKSIVFAGIYSSSRPMRQIIRRMEIKMKLPSLMKFSPFLTAKTQDLPAYARGSDFSLYIEMELGGQHFVSIYD